MTHRRIDGRAETRYPDNVSTTDRLFETLKDLLSASNPGLVTRDELALLERRVDELAELVEALEARLQRLPAKRPE